MRCHASRRALLALRWRVPLRDGRRHVLRVEHDRPEPGQVPGCVSRLRGVLLCSREDHARARQAAREVLALRWQRRRAGGRQGAARRAVERGWEVREVRWLGHQRARRQLQELLAPLRRWRGDGLPEREQGGEARHPDVPARSEARAVVRRHRRQRAAPRAALRADQSAGGPRARHVRPDPRAPAGCRGVGACR